jgi:hypothetical protein
MKERGGSQRNAGRIFSLFRLTRIERRLFWWTEASAACSNLSVAVTCQHTNSASSPIHLQLMGEGGEPGEHCKHNLDIPGPLAFEDPGVAAVSPGEALPETPAPVARSTKSYSKLPTSSPSQGPAPTTSMSADPCNAPPALNTSDNDAIIGRLRDIARGATDRCTTETNEA